MEAQKASKGGFCISFCPDIGDMSTTLLCQEPLDSADTEKGPEKAEARVSMVFHLFSNCLNIFEACICQGERKVCGLWTCACGANPGILIHAHKTYHVCAHIEEIQGIIISLDFWAWNLECGIMTLEKAQKCLLFSWCARPGRLQWGSNKPASEGQISIKGRWFQPRFASFCS